MTTIERGQTALLNNTLHKGTEVLILTVNTDNGVAQYHIEQSGEVGTAPLVQLTPKEFPVTIIFGEEECQSYSNGKEYETCNYSFTSQAAKDAFLEGVEETVGWMAYENISDHEGETNETN